jgi:adenylate kinase family enzyme
MKETAPVQRIAIVGNGGAGKTVLANRLGPLLGIPVTYLDALRYTDTWAVVPEEEYAARQREVVARDRWIIVPLTEPNLTFPQLSDRFGSRSFCLS